MSIYTENGFTNREDYLTNLAGDFDVPTNIVFELADLLGDIEDFDGLVSSLGDYEFCRGI